jgi:hypothetical protein
MTNESGRAARTQLRTKASSLLDHRALAVEVMAQPQIRIAHRGAVRESVPGRATATDA